MPAADRRPLRRPRVACHRVLGQQGPSEEVLPAPALSVRLGAGAPAWWREPAAPSGLGGGSAPRCPVGRLGSAGCSLRCELPSLPPHSAAATSRQHTAPPAESRAPGCPTRPAPRPPARRGLREQGPARPARTLAQPHRGGQRPGVPADSTPLASPRPSVSRLQLILPSPRPHTPGGATHALLAQKPPTAAPAEQSGSRPRGRVHGAMQVAAAQAHEPRGRPCPPAHGDPGSFIPNGQRVASAPCPPRDGRSQAVARLYHGHGPVTNREPVGTADDASGKLGASWSCSQSTRRRRGC